MFVIIDYRFGLENFKMKNQTFQILTSVDGPDLRPKKLQKE